MLGGVDLRGKGGEKRSLSFIILAQSGIVELRNYREGGAVECAEEKGFYTSAVLSPTVSEVIAKRGRGREGQKKDKPRGNGCHGVIDVSTERLQT